MEAATTLRRCEPSVRSVQDIMHALTGWPKDEPFPVSYREAVRLAHYFAKALDESESTAAMLERIGAGKTILMGHRLEVL